MCFFSTADAIAATPSRSPKPYEIKNLSSGSEGVPQTWLTTIYTYITYTQLCIHTYIFIYKYILTDLLTYLHTYLLHTVWKYVGTEQRREDKPRT